jgi:hypothetical protein
VHCGASFILNRLELPDILVAEVAFPCPHCRRTASREHPHRIADLSVTTSPFRKPQYGEVWHYSEFCSKWPVDDFLEIDFRPRAEICNECRVLVRS